MAHKFEPMEEPSAELEELLVTRLDQTIGPAAPDMPPPRQAAADASVVAEKQAQDRDAEFLRLCKKQLDNPKPREKFSDMQRCRFAGWSGQESWETCSISLKRLEKYISKPDEMAQKIMEEMTATARKHGLRLNAVHITKAIATMIGKAQLQHDNAPRPVASSVHKSLNHTHFLPWSAEEWDQRVADDKAQGESVSTRTLQESKEIAASGARRTPSNYTDMCAATEAYYCFNLTFFTADSELTKECSMLHETLQSMLADKEAVTAQTWRTLSWKMISNDAQYFSVLTSADDLYEQENLPHLVLHFVIPLLRSDLTLTMPSNILRQWTAGQQKKSKR